MVRLVEWMLNGVAWMLAIYTFNHSLWVHALLLGAIAMLLTYLTVEPALMRRGWVKQSLFDLLPDYFTLK